MAKRVKVDIQPVTVSIEDEKVARSFQYLVRHGHSPDDFLAQHARIVGDAYRDDKKLASALWDEYERLAQQIAPLGPVESVPFPARTDMLHRMYEMKMIGFALRFAKEDARLAKFAATTPDGPVRAKVCEVLFGSALGLPRACDREVMALLSRSKDPEVIFYALEAEAHVDLASARARWQRVLRANKPREWVGASLDVATRLAPDFIEAETDKLVPYLVDADQEIADAAARALVDSKKALLALLRWATTQRITKEHVDGVLRYLYAGTLDADEMTELMQRLMAVVTESGDTRALASVKKIIKHFQIPTAPTARKKQAKPTAAARR